MIQNISQWNATLKELKSLVASQRIRTFLQLDTHLWSDTVFSRDMPKGRIMRPICNGPVPARRAACRCMRSMRKKYIFQTLNIDGKEMLVIYKNNVYDITPKQDEISVTFLFHVVHTLPHFVPHPPRNSISYQAISRPLQRVQQNNVLCLSS